MHGDRAESIQQARYCPINNQYAARTLKSPLVWPRPHLDYLRSWPVEIDLHDIGRIMGN